MKMKNSTKLIKYVAIIICILFFLILILFGIVNSTRNYFFIVQLVEDNQNAFEKLSNFHYKVIDNSLNGLTIIDANINNEQSEFVYTVETNEQHENTFIINEKDKMVYMNGALLEDTNAYTTLKERCHTLLLNEGIIKAFLFNNIFRVVTERNGYIAIDCGGTYIYYVDANTKLVDHAIGTKKHGNGWSIKNYVEIN